MLIESGHAEAAIAGGCEECDPHFHAGFDSMRAYNADDNEHPERASRPYAADRAGFIFSEGAGIVVLETRAAAEARGATILGSVRGWGMSSDGEGDMVAPSSDGARRAIEMALAARRPDARPTSTTSTRTARPRRPATWPKCAPSAPSSAIRRVAYSSTKGYTGHTVSAAGAIEAIFTLLMLKGGWVAPSVNARPLDPELADYPPVLEPDVDAAAPRAVELVRLRRHQRDARPVGSVGRSEDPRPRTVQTAGRGRGSSDPPLRSSSSAASFVTVDQLRAVPATPTARSTKSTGKPYQPFGLRRLTTQHSRFDTWTRSSSSFGRTSGSRGRRAGGPARNTM